MTRKYFLTKGLIGLPWLCGLSIFKRVEPQKTIDVNLTGSLSVNHKELAEQIRKMHLPIQDLTKGGPVFAPTLDLKGENPFEQNPEFKPPFRNESNDSVQE